MLVTLLASLDYFEGKPHSHAGEFYALMLFGASGMMFMTCSVELLMVFIGLEISSISTYIMAGFRKGQATASESSLKYFLLGSFATAFFLYGIALCFGATGSTSIAAIHNSIAATATPHLAILAIAMVLIGLGFKVSLAPFHVWTPDVYQGAPAPVVGLMSTAPKAAAFAVLLRFLFNGMPTLRPHWIILIELLAVASMCIGNLGALVQKDVKRLLAYSSIAHAGYLLVAFSSTRENAISAALFYTAAYAAMNVGAFLVITAASGYDENARTIDDYTGLALRRPGLAALLGFLPHLADRDSVHRRILRQVLLVHRGHVHGPRVARYRGPHQLRRGLLLLPAAAGRALHAPGRRDRSHDRYSPSRRPDRHRARRQCARNPGPWHHARARPAPDPALDADHAARRNHSDAGQHCIPTAGSRGVDLLRQTTKGLRVAEAFSFTTSNLLRL